MKSKAFLTVVLLAVMGLVTYAADQLTINNGAIRANSFITNATNGSSKLTHGKYTVECAASGGVSIGDIGSTGPCYINVGGEVGIEIDPGTVPVFIRNLPAADPHVADQLWCGADGIVRRSAG